MRWMFALGAVLALFSSACTATVGDGAAGDVLPGAGGPGAAGTSGVPGAGGGAGVDAGTGGAPAQPSHVRVLRRLNRVEYNNTVRDLLGTSLRPADKLPDEAAAEGFDTNGEALTIGVVHVSTFEEAARQLVDELYAWPETDERRRAVLVCQLAAGAEATCARQIFSAFARRAFRRPVVEAEIERLLQLVEKVRALGETYENAVKAALVSVLVSPHFLFMVEKGELAPGVVEPLDDHELATRLSYFLWSSMPDSALFADADAGGLAGDPAKIAAEARRMLGDSKAEALARDFGGQWLTLRRLELVAPSEKTFPTYDTSLRDAAWRESELFLAALVEENAPIESLLTAKFTFVNQRLAQHYGLSAAGAGFQRVDLTSTQRLGILGHASVLMANSQSGWTSPTKRGAWVLEQLLCAPPPPVPDDLMIEPLPEPPPGQTKREQLEQHRKEARCAGCHALMDPIGLGLESFDAIGGFRTLDNMKPVDASGVLEGKPFSGLRELTELLKTDQRLQGCFARQLLTYAVGRSFQGATGDGEVSALVQSAASAGRTGMKDVVEAVVQSEAFRARRGE